MDVITFPENLETTSGLSILLQSVISLRDATSYDNACFVFISHLRKSHLQMLVNNIEKHLNGQHLKLKP